MAVRCISLKMPYCLCTAQHSNLGCTGTEATGATYHPSSSSRWHLLHNQRRSVIRSLKTGFFAYPLEYAVHRLFEGLCKTPSVLGLPAWWEQRLNQKWIGERLIAGGVEIGIGVARGHFAGIGMHRTGRVVILIQGALEGGSDHWLHICAVFAEVSFDQHLRFCHQHKQ
jgi:hypothetical protein